MQREGLFPARSLDLHSLEVQIEKRSLGLSSKTADICARKGNASANPAVAGPVRGRSGRIHGSHQPEGSHNLLRRQCSVHNLEKRPSRTLCFDLKNHANLDPFGAF
jgi:hypothetical protein